MDGVLAPLEEIVELARTARRSHVLVDEAHATGASARTAAVRSLRRGSRARLTSMVGTLGKALGSYGAYACADAEMVRYLINTARSLIFSTAPAAARRGRGAGRARAPARTPAPASSG